MFRCELCPFRCAVDRETHMGRCKAGREMIVRAALPHFYEEPPISGRNGSGTIFFAGCGLHCEYCQNREISEVAEGKTVTPSELVLLIRHLEEESVHNINFVTPTHFTDKIIEALRLYKPKVPVIWNTSGYEREETIESLLPYVDIFLTDYKYADGELSARYSHAANYPEVAKNAIDKMVEEKPLIYSADGEILLQGVIVRHLVLPASLKNTEQVTNIFKQRWEGRAILSIMGQYTPNGAEKFAELKRPLKPLEYRIAIQNAEKQGLNDFFIQENGAVGKQYVPDFQLLK